MNNKPIITVKEARKLLGKEARTLSDEEIIELITDLNEIAKYFLNNTVLKSQDTD